MDEREADDVLDAERPITEDHFRPAALAAGRLSAPRGAQARFGLRGRHACILTARTAARWLGATTTLLCDLGVSPLL